MTLLGPLGDIPKIQSLFSCLGEVRNKPNFLWRACLHALCVCLLLRRDLGGPFQDVTVMDNLFLASHACRITVDLEGGEGRYL